MTSAKKNFDGMTVFPEVTIPNPLEYVKFLIHEDKVRLNIWFPFRFPKTEEASLHLVDLLSRSQETDDQELKSWYAFYNNCICAKSDQNARVEDFLLPLSVRQPSEEVDACLIVHSCLVMATLLSHEPKGAKSWPFAKNRTSNHSNAPVLIGNLHPNYDRVWHLVKSQSSTSPLVLNSLARRLLNILPGGYNDRIDFGYRQCLEAVDVGKIYRSLCSGNSRDLEYRGSDHVSTIGNGPKVNDLDSTLALCDELIRSMTSTSQTVPSALLCKMATGLSLAVRKDLPTSRDRFLIRLSQIRLKQNRIAEAIVLLDDIEPDVVVNCNLTDCGLLFQTRAECLLKLASDEAQEEHSILIEAFKDIQFAIAAYDRVACIPNLLRSTMIAACIANRISSTGLTNFYSVKFAAICSQMDGVSQRHFPCDQDDDKLIPGSFMINTGQPKVPSEITLSPRGKTCLLPPTSPKGRGMQTLISWRQ
jgi:hypothetical protein